VRIGQLVELCVHRGQHDRMLVTEARHGRPAAGVNVAPACFVDQVDAFAADGARVRVMDLSMQ
jgi:hypothetical protein